MKQPKIFFLSIGIIFFIVFLTLFFVIFPIHHRHVALQKEEYILSMVEKKSVVIKKSIARNSENIHLIRDRLQEEFALPFLEDALNLSQLAIESIKPDQGSEHDEIHLVLKGEYRKLLNFISLLSQRPSSMVVTDLTIEKTRAELILKNTDKKIAVVKIKRSSNLLERLNAALVAIEIPTFSLEPVLRLQEVRSPFMPRVFFKNKTGPFQSLEDVDWYLAGEVCKNGALLGVFLDTKNHSQSRYFGIDLPWENSCWRIIAITRGVVVFEESKKHIRWSLAYQ